MSENITIIEGGLTRKISPVDRLRVNNQGGGSSLWRNAEELEMDSLEVSENGLYVALDEDLYAYDTITVDVQEASEDEKKAGKTVVGKDPTTGDDHAIGVDEDGNLTEERVPDSIEVGEPPVKLKYVNGEEIDFTGIRVYLKYGDNLYTDENYPTGEIPFEELVFPITEATGGQSIDIHGNATITIDWRGSESSTLYEVISGSAKCTGVYENPYMRTSDNAGCAGKIIWASYSRFTLKSTYEGNTYTNNAYSTTVDGVSFYYYSSGKGITGNIGDESHLSEISISCVPGSVVSKDEFAEIDASASKQKEIAYSLLTGEITNEMHIPVQWIRPQDGEVLEDTFEIVVVADEHDPVPPPEPDPDPFVDHYDFEYQGAKYNFVRSDIRGMSYSSGYVLVTYMDTMQTYTVADALKYNLIVRVSSTHTGGDF